MKEKLESAADQWLKSGRDRRYLLTGKALLVSQCWLYKAGNCQHESVSDFVAAGKASLGGEAGWNALLSEKTECPGCRLSFHLENIGICTGCMEYVCGGCRLRHAQCDGEFVG